VYANNLKMPRKNVSAKNTYYVRKIHGRRFKDGTEEFLVEWDGFPRKKDYSWEPKEGIQHTVSFKQYIDEGSESPNVSEAEDPPLKPLSTKRGTKRKSEEPQTRLYRKKFRPTKRKDTSGEKYNVAADQGWKCNLCLEPLPRYFEIDHIMPLEYGGLNRIENYQALCCTCHGYKTAILDRTVILQLIQANSQPTRNDILTQCRIWYMMRNRTHQPTTDSEMMTWSVSVRNVFNGMVKERERTCSNIMDGVQDEELTMTSEPQRNEPVSAPPHPEGTPGMSSDPMENIVSIIEQMDWMGMQESSFCHEDSEIYDPQGVKRFFPCLFTQEKG
jgi:5-methylcytosine-specific restriction endonuclease McrA